MNEYKCVAPISLYDSIYISEFIDTPFNLYGARLKPYATWIPIKYEDVKNYDIVIERSIAQDDGFVVIKLGEEMREDLR
jgi:hypothetical protein